MARFDPSKYADVNERIPLFYKQYDNGSIHTEIVEHTQEYVVVKASLLVDDAIRATGFAQEFRAFDRAKTQSGGEYEPVNMFNYIENAETSAIGRALANFNFSGSKERPSAQEMDKVKRMEGMTPQAKISSAQIKQLHELLELAGVLAENEMIALQSLYGSEVNIRDIAYAEAANLINVIKNMQPELLLNISEGQPF